MLEAQDDGELNLPYWLTSTEEAADTAFLKMLRRLPRLLREAWLLGWRASRATTVTVLVLQLAAGFAAAVGLISVVGVFGGLLQAGPTPERVRAAVPSLLLMVGSLAVRGLLRSAATAAHGRLFPMVFEAAEMRLLDLTTRLDLAMPAGTRRCSPGTSPTGGPLRRAVAATGCEPGLPP